VLITGGVGTGKTVLSKKFCLDIEEYGRARGKPIEFVHINCHKNNTNSLVMLKVLQHFQPGFPDRGFSVPEMLNILKKELNKKRCHLIVVLDEANVLISKSGSDLIYDFTRFDEEDLWSKGSLSLILISQRYVLDSLTPSALSTFKRSNVIELGSYKQNELVDILMKRVELAFHEGCVRRETVELIADIAEREGGDARFAIELLEKAGMLADEERMDKVVPEHARAAKAYTKSTMVESKLMDLDVHKKLVLLSIARALKGEAYTTTGEVERAYGVVCEEYEERPRGHTQFWHYLQDLANHGFIDTKRSGTGMLGSTTLISIHDLPTKVLEGALRKLLDSGKSM
jgi:cell division control protein 6